MDAPHGGRDLLHIRRAQRCAAIQCATRNIVEVLTGGHPAGSPATGKRKAQGSRGWPRLQQYTTRGGQGRRSVGRSCLPPRTMTCGAAHHLVLRPQTNNTAWGEESACEEVGPPRRVAAQRLRCVVNRDWRGSRGGRFVCRRRFSPTIKRAVHSMSGGRGLVICHWRHQGGAIIASRRLRRSRE